MRMLDHATDDYSSRQRAKEFMRENGIDTDHWEAAELTLRILKRHDVSDWAQCIETLRITQPTFFVF